MNLTLKKMDVKVIALQKINSEVDGSDKLERCDDLIAELEEEKKYLKDSVSNLVT